MSGTELYELVKGWPREAWPERVVYNDSVPDFARWTERMTEQQGRQLATDFAAALFRDSGLRWLMRSGPISLLTYGDGEEVLLEVCNRVDQYRPTLLHAISAAIAKAESK